MFRLHFDARIWTTFLVARLALKAALALLTSTEVAILDGATVTTAELNIIDGGTSATSTTLRLQIAW